MSVNLDIGSLSRTGRGLMTEAVNEMLHHAFEDCGMQKVWAGLLQRQ